MVTIKICKSTWKFLKDMALKVNGRKWKPPVTLSCNQKELWLCKTKGYHHKKDRDAKINIYKYHKLQKLMGLRMSWDRIGGRFHLTEKKAFLPNSIGGHKLCNIKIVDC